MNEFFDNLRNRFFGVNRIKSVLEKRLDDIHCKLQRVELMLLDFKKA
jgi:hypothetical protein